MTEIDAALASALVAEQFPRWADLRSRRPGAHTPPVLAALEELQAVARPGLRRDAHQRELSITGQR